MATASMECTQDLRAEHRAVSVVLAVIEEMEERLEASITVAPEDMRDVVGFLREFVDGCHHAKEERMLFPALRESGVSGFDDTLEQLETEHVMGREYVGRIDEEIERYENGDVEMARRLAEDLHGYAQLLKRHIDTEEGVLFPQAEDALPADDQRALAEAYRRHERDVVGEGRHEAFHAMIDRFRAAYLQR